MRTVSAGINNNFLVKAGLESIRSGDILSVKIIENSKGLIKASVKGKIVVLKGGKDLLPGTVVRLKAQWSGKTLFLSSGNNKSETLNMITGGGKPDNVSLTLFQTARRAGLHLKPENIRLLNRLYRKKKAISREQARFSVECLKKGLNPEEVLPFFEQNEERNRDDSDRTLLLFNQLKAGDELWFIIPYRLKAGDSSLQGTLRFKKNISSGNIETLVIETWVDSTRLYFLLDNRRNRKKIIRLFADGKIEKQMRKRIKSALPEILGNLNLKFDDNITEDCFGNENKKISFDGFSYETVFTESIEELV